MSARISISLVEDREPTRALLRRCLGRQPDFVLWDDFADAGAALTHMPRRRPNVAIVDWHLGDGLMDGIKFIPRIKELFPDICCLLYTAYQLEELPLEAFRSGADGFIYKSDKITRLPDRIRAALRGEFPLSARARQFLFSSLRTAGVAAIAPGHSSFLYPHEIQVLRLLAAGKTTQEVAKAACLTEAAVTTFRKNAFHKLNVHQLPEALLKLREASN